MSTHSAKVGNWHRPLPRQHTPCPALPRRGPIAAGPMAPRARLDGTLFNRVPFFNENGLRFEGWGPIGTWRVRIAGAPPARGLEAGAPTCPDRSSCDPPSQRGAAPDAGTARPPWQRPRGRGPRRCGDRYSARRGGGSACQGCRPAASRRGRRTLDQQSAREHRRPGAAPWRSSSRERHGALLGPTVLAAANAARRPDRVQDGPATGNTGACDVADSIGHALPWSTRGAACRVPRDTAPGRGADCTPYTVEQAASYRRGNARRRRQGRGLRRGCW